LVLKFVLKIPQAVMQRLCRLLVQFWPNFVQTRQQRPRRPEEFRRRADGFAFARSRARRDPDCECGKPFRPLKPLIQNGQPGQAGISIFVNLLDTSTIFKSFSGMFVRMKANPVSAPEFQSVV
jgi:hypothetical protein